MKKKRFIYAFCIGATSLVVTASVAYAATHDITSFLGGTSGDMFDVKGTMMFDSIKVGRQGTGGVTFFNGTIVNNTTNDGADNPVTFGDNVRIDGRVYRGAVSGTADAMPFLVNDNMEVAGSLTAGSLSTGALTATSLVGSGIVASDNLASDSVTTAKIYDSTIATADLADSAITSAKISDGAIATADLASGAVTQAIEDDGYALTTTTSGNDFDIAAEIEMTTGVSSLFCMFSAYGTIDTPDTTMRIALLYDDEVALRTVRDATVGHDNVGHVILTTSAIFETTAGTHTIQLGWNTSAGTTASMFYDTLDCLELKR